MKLLKFIFFICLFGCNSSDRNINEPLAPVSKKDSTKIVTVQSAAKSIEDLPNYIWVPHHPDTTNYLCEMHFKDEHIVYFFNGQCAYFFFTYARYIKPQVITVMWTYKTDCSHRISSLHKTNGVEQYPKYGDDFARFRLINDTTLSVEYMFPKWVERVNQIAKDSLFPQRFYLKN